MDLLHKIIVWKAYAQTALEILIGIFILVPGPHPEDWLTKIRDVIASISRK